MKTVILIPARYASTRYPGKPLVELRGPDGPKSLIRRSWEAAMAVPGVAEVHVVTDDDRIRTAAEAFGASDDFTHGLRTSPARLALRAINPAAITLRGFEVLVQLVIAAMITAPSGIKPSASSTRPAAPKLGGSSPVGHAKRHGVAR